MTGAAKSSTRTRRRQRQRPQNQSSGGGVASSTRNLLCSDGITRILYEVLGGDTCSRSTNANADAARTTTVFVVCHDLFDCLDATKLLFLDLLRRHPQCRILVYNQPGQAGTTFPVPVKASDSQHPAQAQALTNDFHASILHQLLHHVRSTGELPMDASSTGSTALHLIGIGNGVSVLLGFLDRYGGDEAIGTTLKSLVSINGYASIDAQLAGILHSAKNAFQSFPPNRPDLPISYLSHFMFSDQYIDRVSMDLALTIHTAVLNPISLEGRIRLVDGALKNRSMPHVDKIVERVGVPIIAIQSTENRIVASTNVDALLRGRPVSHIWSHELQYAAGKENDCYSQVGLNDMLNGCFQRDGDGNGSNADALSSLAIFVRAGHCITQECKGPICGLLDRLVVVVPSSLSSGIDRAEHRKDDKHILRLSPPHPRRLPPAEEGGKRRNGAVHARVGEQETKTTGNKKKNSSSFNDKQNAEMRRSKLRQSPHGRGKKKRGTKTAAKAGNTSCTSDRRKLKPKPKKTPEGGNSDGHEAAPEPSPESLEKEDTGSASPSVMPYIVEGAPNCSLDELTINETGARTTSSNMEGEASGKVPKLEDYISRGVPSELIPTEIKAGPPLSLIHISEPTRPISIS